jgi:hypothetical protein
VEKEVEVIEPLIPEVEVEVVVTATPEPAHWVGEPGVWKAYFAFEPYAWLDGNEWQVAIGNPNDVEIEGESLGRAPWIAVCLRLTNPSRDQGQTITAAHLHVTSFEPVSASAGHTLTVRSDLVPYFLIPEDCPQPGTPSPFHLKGFPLPDAEHLLGMLSKSTSEPTKLWRGQNADWFIPAHEYKEYIIFVTSSAPGKYIFSVNMELKSTDLVTSTLELGPWEYAFLDAETALVLPKHFVGPRCPP